MSEQTDHENATCSSFHSGKSHSAWLDSECGGCVDAHPSWTHKEWHHTYHHLPPAHCNEVHPPHTHEEFRHKCIACKDFHPEISHYLFERYLTFEWFGYSDELTPPLSRPQNHGGWACVKAHPKVTHFDWERLNPPKKFAKSVSFGPSPDEYYGNTPMSQESARYLERKRRNAPVVSMEDRMKGLALAALMGGFIGMWVGGILFNELVVGIVVGAIVMVIVYFFIPEKS